MPLNSDFAVNQLLVPAAVLFFLVWGIVGAAIGAGLIFSTERTLQLFGVLNRYVSTRHASKSLAVPHDIGHGVRRYRRLIGACFVLGAAFSIYGLLAWFDSGKMVAALGRGHSGAFTAWLLESLRWSLIVLNVVAVCVGVMLGWFPMAMHRLEAVGNRWYSVRQLTAGGDSMHLTLDRLVGAFPRTAGSIIVITALYVTANAAILWMRFH